MKNKFNPESEFETVILDMTYTQRYVDEDNRELLKSIQSKVEPNAFEKIKELIDKIQGEIIDITLQGGLMNSSGKIITFSDEEKQFMLENSEMMLAYGHTLEPQSTLIYLSSKVLNKLIEKSEFDGKLELIEKINSLRNPDSKAYKQTLSIFISSKINTLDNNAKIILRDRFIRELKNIGYYFYLTSMAEDPKRSKGIAGALVDGAIYAIQRES